MNYGRKILSLGLSVLMLLSIVIVESKSIKADDLIDTNLGERYTEENLDEFENLFLVEVKDMKLADIKEEVLVEDEYVYNGPKLTRSKGTNQGPSGKETYYNLPMGGVIRIMRGIGNNDQYWVREDGVKMLGKYVIIAANLNIRPRGSLVPTSLGMGIVCDTGGFARHNPTQIDIAVAW